MSDIIAESQTEAVIAKLRRGEGTDALRDEVSAALLSSMSELVSEVRTIKGSLWTAGDLQRAIDERHRTLCAGCPAKSKAGGSVERILSPTVMIFVMAILSLFTAMYVMIGRQGLIDVTEAANPIVNRGK